MTAPTSSLSGWRSATFTTSGLTHEIYEKDAAPGAPGVVVIPEIPGLTPEVLAFADHLVSAGFRVVIPSLFGTAGRDPSTGYVLTTVAKLCVSRELRAFARHSARPVSVFLRALAADLAASTGRRVGVVGMCFTGGFALATAVDPAVAAAVMSQPSVPFPIGSARVADIGLSDSERTEVVGRQDLALLSLRFSEDQACRHARFQTYAQAFGERIELIELDSRPGNPDGFGKRAHAVLTHEVRADPPNSAYLARERVVEFLRQAL